MLYDQGLIIETNDLRFYSNFKYTLKEDWATPDQLRRIEVNSYEAFDSRCGETMVGLVQLRTQPGSMKCFSGHKLEADPERPSERVQHDYQSKVVFFPQVGRSSRQFLGQIRYEEMGPAVT